MLNQITLGGRLATDIEEVQLESKSLFKFNLAVPDSRDDAMFIACEAWDMQHLPRFLTKGAKVVVAGSLQESRWQTREGEKRKRFLLRVRQVEFMSAAPAGDGKGVAAVANQRA